ncbi:MAG: tail fiber domain-containing protein, partial [Salinivirgaceae bacterium]|nr:tail fiber domain-containing protein [Salinivirgaceae bacterium]
VDDDPTEPGKAAKSKFAVAGKKAKDGEDDNYLVVNKAGTQVFVDEGDDKAAKSKFAVAGKKAKGSDTLLVVNLEGTKVFIDEVSGKAAKSKFAVAGKSAKGDNPNYLIIDSDSTRVYIDTDDDGKAAKSGFAVAGKRTAKGGNADILKVTKDSTRVYVDGGGAKSGFGVEGKGGSGKSGFAVSEKGSSGNAGYMNVSGANFFAGYNAGKSTNVQYDRGGEIPNDIANLNTDPNLLNITDNALLGVNNIYIGNNAGKTNYFGVNNVFLGVNAGYSLGPKSDTDTKPYMYFSYDNVLLGTNAAKNAKKLVGSVVIGNNAGRGSESYDPKDSAWISSDIFIGDNAGFSNTSGSENVFIGKNAGRANTTGGNNVYIGNGAGRNNTESWSNTLINNTGGQGTGNDNIIIGGVSDGTDLSFGNGNIIIGLNALWPSYYEKDASGRLVIGTWITGKGEQVKIEKSLFVNGSMTLYGHLKSNTNGINDIGSSDWRFKTLYAKGINLYRSDGKYTGNVAGSLIPEEEDQNLGGISPYNADYTYRWNAIYGKTLDLSDGATIEGGLTVSSGGATIKGKLTVSGTSGAYIGGGVYPSGNYYNNLGKTDNRWNYVYGNYFYGTQSVEAPYVRATKQLTANSSASDMPNKGLEVSRTTPATNSDYYSSYYGGYFYMNGDHTGNVYGIYTYAMGKGTNYGIYSKAGYGTTNWAGYFDGDVKAGTVIPLANTSYDLGSDTYRWRTIYGHSMNVTTANYDYPVFVKSTKVSSESYNAAIYGESTNGKNRNIGVDARATSTQTGVHNHAVNGEASGGSYAVGIYGYAKNATYNYAGYFDGLVYINGSTYGSSDFRLKKDVQTISGALDKVLKLRGVSYYWKNREEMAAVKGVSADSMKYGFDSKKHIGVIAQEIEQEFPELINTDADGFKSVSYEGIAPILIEAVKELKAEKDELQTTVANQQQQIDELKRLVEELLKKQ